MNTRQTENIKDSINMCKMRLKTILPHLTSEKTVLNETFNKLLIETVGTFFSLVLVSNSTIFSLSDSFLQF